MEKHEEAQKRFNAGFNCAQSVIGTFSPELGLDEASAMKISSAFGGGINNMGKTCGAIAGALMVIGMKYGKTEPIDVEKQALVKHLSKEVISKFRKRHGSIECSELLGLDVTSRHQKPASELYSNCPLFVGDVSKIVAKLIEEDFKE